MNDCVEIKKNNGKIEVNFDFQTGKAGKINKKIAEYSDENDLELEIDAAFLNHTWRRIIVLYFMDNAPNLLKDDEIELSGKGDRLTAYYDDTPEGEAEANKYAEAIRVMTENDKKVMDLVEQFEW